MNQQVTAWLEEKNDTKGKLVSMLLDRLLYKSLEKYLEGGELKGLEFQVMATDICSYAFPGNIEKVIRAIGRLEPVNDFDGCGTADAEIKSFITGEYKRLCIWLKKDRAGIDSIFGKKEPFKIWLVACLAKTMKEQTHLVYPLPDLVT